MAIIAGKVIIEARFGVACCVLCFNPRSRSDLACCTAKGSTVSRKKLQGISRGLISLGVLELSCRRLPDQQRQSIYSSEPQGTTDTAQHYRTCTSIQMLTQNSPFRTRISAPTMNAATSGPLLHDHACKAVAATVAAAYLNQQNKHLRHPRLQGSWEWELRGAQVGCMLPI